MLRLLLGWFVLAAFASFLQAGNRITDDCSSLESLGFAQVAIRTTGQSEPEQPRAVIVVFADREKYISIPETGIEILHMDGIGYLHRGGGVESESKYHNYSFELWHLYKSRVARFLSKINAFKSVYGDLQENEIYVLSDVTCSEGEEARVMHVNAKAYVVEKSNKEMKIELTVFGNNPDFDARVYVVTIIDYDKDFTLDGSVRLAGWHRSFEFDDRISKDEIHELLGGDKFERVAELRDFAREIWRRESELAKD